MTTPSAARLVVDSLSCRYGKTYVLEKVSFSASTGVTGIVGANGAGKTTLLRTIAGVLKPASGSIAIRAKKGRDRIGYLPQSPAATPLLSTQSYVEYFALLAGMPSRHVADAACAALTQVGLADRARQRTSKLSGGMFRRVALAAALVAEPDIVLLDEPTAGLDPLQRANLREMIAELGKLRTVLVATHILEDIATIAERVVVLNGRAKVFEGTPEELIRTDAAARSGATATLESAFVALMHSTDER